MQRKNVYSRDIILKALQGLPQGSNLEAATDAIIRQLAAKDLHIVRGGADNTDAVSKIKCTECGAPNEHQAWCSRWHAERGENPPLTTPPVTTPDDDDRVTVAIAGLQYRAMPATAELLEKILAEDPASSVLAEDPR